MDILRTGQGQTIKNEKIFEKWISFEKNTKVEGVIQFILKELKIKKCPRTAENDLKEKVRLFDNNLDRRWKACTRNRTLFARRHGTWLKNDFILPKSIINFLENAVFCGKPSSSRGRPLKEFSDLSQKTKKRRVSELLKSNSTEELQFAAKMSKRLSGGELEEEENERILKPKEALALYLDLDLSERKYNLLRSVVNALHENCFPSLYELRKVKKLILPIKRDVTENSASVDLQELLNKTSESIAEISGIHHDTTATLICKWGFDGSSGHSQYKQIFTDSESTDEFLFLVALSPLKLVDDNTGKEFWKSPRTSSTMFCRPIKFMFVKECPELVRNEEAKMKSLIDQLSSTSFTKRGFNFKISFKLMFTMVDGSICNILSNTNSSSKCFICGATPKEMNSLQVQEKPAKLENFRFGLSTLHSWIRCFECLLHISYRLPFKSWRVLQGSENKSIFNERKRHIQTMFKNRLGLIVDKPKPGFGSTNDGNTARRFFQNSKITSEITGLDEHLIYKFSIILRVLASGFPIDIDRFSQLLSEVKERYLELYSWYYMPISVHKLLIHGPDIISSFEIPIGQLSEEALEASHKEFRRNRLSHTRKSSRISTNEDLLTILLLKSDPLISHQRKTDSRLPKADLSDIRPYIKMEENFTNLSSSPGTLSLGDSYSDLSS